LGDKCHWPARPANAPPPPEGMSCLSSSARLGPLCPCFCSFYPLRCGQN
jgi:hypothetical protein